MFKFKYLIILIIFVFLFLGRNLVKKGLNQIIVPINTISQKASAAISQLASIDDIIRENHKLKKENIKLNSNISELTEIKSENKLLKDQLNINEKKQSWDLHLVQTIGLNRFLFINQNFEKELPVIASKNILVGITNKQGILLSIDPDSKISAIIQGSNIKTIAQGSFGTKLIINLAISENRVKPGQLVISSGAQGRFPRGLIIGQIKNVEKTPNHLSKRAIIEPFYRAQELDKVFVITNF